MGYANVTLTSLEGDLSVVIYLPIGIKPNEALYYFSSRFDHGSMIGSITRKVRLSTGEVRTHTLYQDGMWRQPHNTNWPESGVGLAAEFGVGDDGDLCLFRCGWNGSDDLTNGVLGYREARIGEPFLKIGVGKLIKGTCPDCDSAEDYKFNSPYQFAEIPEWKMSQSDPQSVQLTHKAYLRDHGYGLKKEISLVGETLSVTTTLTNLGRDAFSTVWYSHNFFTCDGIAVGPGYGLDLNLKGNQDPIYEEPGTWSWATPLKDYARVKRDAGQVHVDMVRAIEPGVRIKSEFTRDDSTDGGFTFHACSSKIQSSIPQTQDPDSGVSMYAYNLYIERGTMSPEPQILLRMDPGQSSTWSQKLTITDESSTEDAWKASFRSASLSGTVASSASLLARHPVAIFLATLVLLALTLQGIVRFRQSRQRKHRYTRIADVSESTLAEER